MSPTGGGDFEDPKAWGPLQGGRGRRRPRGEARPGGPPWAARQAVRAGGPRYSPTLPAGFIISWGRGPHSVPAPNPKHTSVRPRPVRRPLSSVIQDADVCSPRRPSTLKRVPGHYDVPQNEPGRTASQRRPR